MFMPSRAATEFVLHFRAKWTLKRIVIKFSRSLKVFKMLKMFIE